jgi:ubiquinone/menaquinone biosynthesis C-methylase UbiE
VAEHVCPVWIGYLLVSPLRKLFQNPLKILGPYVKEEMKVLDVGCGMGFFSLPLAQLVGPNGKVICVDLQEGMLRSLQKRVNKAGLTDRIEIHLCAQDSLGLDDLREEIDFALAFTVVHEVPDASRLFSEIYRMLKPAAKILVAEPKRRVSRKNFDMEISIAEHNGLQTVERSQISGCFTVLLLKK